MFYRTTALLTRAFRVDARSAQSHFSRLLFAGMILASLVMVHLQSAMFGAPGLHAFTSICWLNFFFITLAGIGLFATAISEEKEEETLGLLRMAGISPVSLLLGKSTTRLVSVLLMLLVQFPFVLLSITLGGVLLEQVLSAYVTLVAYLVFLANLGLACSVFCGNSRRASTLLTLILVVLLVILPIVTGVVQQAWVIQHPTPLNAFQSVAVVLAEWFDKISIWDRISASLATTFRESLLSAQVIVHFLAALALFGLSWAIFDRCTRESHATTRFEKLLTGPIGIRRSHRIGRAWRFALTWKDFYFVAGGQTSIIFRLVLYVIIIGMLTVMQRVSDPQSSTPLYKLYNVVGNTAMWAMLLAAAIELGLFASRVFREEIKSQALPLLAMLPGTTMGLVWSKAAAAGPALFPTLFCFVLGALLDPEDFYHGLKGVSSNMFGLCVLAWYILFLHVTAYLSLVIKWGALPLALFLMFCAIMVVVAATRLFWMAIFRGGPGPNDEIWIFLPAMTVAMAGIVAFYIGICNRLRTLAGR